MLLFRLDEYGAATASFLSDAIHAVARSRHEILSRIAVEQVESLPLAVNTLPSGQMLESEPSEFESLMTFTISDGVAGHFDEIHVAVDDAAETYASGMISRMLKQMSEICDATGNVINVAGRSFWDGILESLETILISFDEDGIPTIPTPLLHPDTAAALGEPPEDFRERYNEILVRRRDEWMAQRRTRRLPRPGH